jgi:hypothetical protein
MVIHHITSATSRFNSITNAFGPPADDTVGADTLIVDTGAYLIATGMNSDGALLPNTNGWTVVVNGMIVSTQSHGLVLGPGAGASTVTIGAEGQVPASNWMATASTPSRIPAPSAALSPRSRTGMRGAPIR